MLNMFLFALIMVLAVPVAAETYKWIDSRGTVSFTDDLAKVPERYRSKVETLGAPPPAAEVTTVEVVQEEAGSGQEAKVSPQDKPENAVPPPKEEEKKKKTYGGKDEEAWKAEFGKLREEIKGIEEQIGEQKRRLADPSNMSRAEYRGIESSIKTLELRLADRKDKLQALNEAAAKADLPAEIRQ